MINVRFLCFFGLTIFCHILSSKDVSLFNRLGDKRVHYNRQIDNLMQGDRLVFSQSNYVFEYLSELGQGTTSKVLEVKVVEPKGFAGKYALRIPLRKTDLETHNFIDLYIKGTQALVDKNVPVPKLHLSKKGQFALVDIIPHDYDLSHFLVNGHKMKDSSLVTKKLFDFLMKAKDFKNIGDFHAGQLVYSQQTQSWTLLDYTDEHVMQKSFWSLMHPGEGLFSKALVHFEYNNDLSDESKAFALSVLRESERLMSIENKKIERSFFMNMCLKHLKAF